MKTRSSRCKYNPGKVIEAHERKLDWRFMIVFLLGAVFGEISADPVSDTAFFFRASNGIPMTPEEEIFYWYYLPSIIYVAMFVIAAVLMTYTRAEAKYFAYALVIFATVSLVVSLVPLGATISTIILLSGPLAVLFIIIFYEIVVWHKGRRIVV